MKYGRLLNTTSLSPYSSHYKSIQSKPDSVSGQTTVELSISTLNISLNTQERGIVLSNPMQLNGTSAIIEDSDVDPGELRRALLFWDRLVWPSTSGIFLGGGPDVEYLINSGKLIRPHFYVNGDAATALCMSFVETYKKLDGLHPGQWVVSHGEKSLRVHGHNIVDGRGVVTQLINAIPVPDRSLPLEDLINFKDKRTPEVIALRTVIDEFYQNWINSEDQDHQLKLALAKIDSASADMIKVARESYLPFSMSSWKINFNLTAPDIVKFGMMIFSGTAFNLGLVNSLLLAGASAVSFGSDVGFSTAKKSSPFNYVASLESALK